MNAKEYEELLSDVEVRIERLKALYEQWFQGIERLEPQIPRKDVERRMNILLREKPRNTALRFRYQMLVQRWTTYLMYWTRVSRQIEEGTYRRDIMKARKRREDMRANRRSMRPKTLSPEAEGAVDESIPIDIPISLGPEPLVAPEIAVAPNAPTPTRARRGLSPFGLGAKAPPPPPADKNSLPAPPATKAAPEPAPPVQKRAAPPPPPPPSPPAKQPTRPAEEEKPFDDRHLRRIYDRYIDARRRNNEGTDVQFETLAKSIKQMEPKLREKHAGKKLDFDIVVQNGKVALKPVGK